PLTRRRDRETDRSPPGRPQVAQLRRIGPHPRRASSERDRARRHAGGRAVAEEVASRQRRYNSAEMSKTQRRVLEAVLVIVAVGAMFWPAGALFYRRYLAAIYIGAVVGLGELVARYRDAPERALTTTPAILYILIN